MSEHDEQHGDIAPDSPIASIRRRVEAAKSKLHLDLRVPRYDPAIYIRYAPVSSARVLKLQSQRSESEDRVVEGNATVLADAAREIYEIKDGRRVSIDPSGDLINFGPRLRDLLGLPETSKGADVVRALYQTDGDVVAAAEQVHDWSGYQMRHEVAPELEGN